jgi:hypothetical protein
MLLGGAVIGLVGVALLISGRMALGVLIGVIGFVVEVGGAWIHDLGHRRRGEQPHALWGARDRNRPSRMPPRRH